MADGEVVAGSQHPFRKNALAVENGILAVGVGNAAQGDVAEVDDDPLVVDAVGDFDGVAGLG
jgi:hypothetical protein